MEEKLGKIILIHGASSAGKSTLAFAVQKASPVPLLRFSFDLFLDGNILPMNRIKNGEFSWREIRPSILNGFYQCLPVLAKAGNNLILDHIIESEGELKQVVTLLKGIDVFFVGLHCSLPELERREKERGNRRQGEARTDFQTVHTYTTYDLELDSENELEKNVKSLLTAWKNRQSPSLFEQMYS